MISSRRMVPPECSPWPEVARPPWAMPFTCLYHSTDRAVMLDGCTTTTLRSSNAPALAAATQIGSILCTEWVVKPRSRLDSGHLELTVGPNWCRMKPRVYYRRAYIGSLPVTGHVSLCHVPWYVSGGRCHRRSIPGKHYLNHREEELMQHRTGASWPWPAGIHFWSSPLGLDIGSRLVPRPDSSLF
jgi:hypothetical protein